MTSLHYDAACNTVFNTRSPSRKCQYPLFELLSSGKFDQGCATPDKMARQKFYKHVEVIDSLQEIYRLIQNYTLPIREIQPTAFDETIQQLHDHLRSSFSLLYVRAKELCGNTQYEATIQERSIFATEGLEKCQEIYD